MRCRRWWKRFLNLARLFLIDVLLLGVGDSTRDRLCLGAAWFDRLVGVVVMEDDLQVLLRLHWDWVVHNVCVSVLDRLHDRTVLAVTTCKSK